MKTTKTFVTTLAVLATALPAAAAPRVATDIPPVHALAARVMDGVGEPGLIMPPGASPHAYAMKPSQAQLVQEADVVFWVGESLTPWLARAIDSLASDARSVALLDAPDVVTLGYREGVTFEDHDHEHDHDHGHDDGHADEAGHDHAHAHGAVDPHAWLDPVNGGAWLAAIAAALSELDPANAATYADNAAAGQAELDALTAAIRADLGPVAQRPFVVFHDAYHYFEARFGVEAAAAIRVSDAAEPGPRRIAEIRETVRAQDAVCVFAEPQFEPALVETVVEGTGAEVGVLDPLGADLELGAALYPALLRGMADSLVDCLAG